VQRDVFDHPVSLHSGAIYLYIKHILPNKPIFPQTV